MIRLNISDECEFILSFEHYDVNKFTMCKLKFITSEFEQEIYEDFLYIFVENMLGRINNIPSLTQESFLGKIGEWQEYYYYETVYNEKHFNEIKMMEKALFISAEKYGIFLYRCKGELWIELDKGFSEFNGLSPYEYYCNPMNYRVYLKKVSEKKVQEWKNILEQYRNLLNMEQTI